MERDHVGSRHDVTLSVSSATSFFSRAFSSRSRFSSRASLTDMPPYFAKEYVSRLHTGSPHLPRVVRPPSAARRDHLRLAVLVDAIDVPLSWSENMMWTWVPFSAGQVNRSTKTNSISHATTSVFFVQPCQDPQNGIVCLKSPRA
jgi:hypothetical protein